MGKIMNLDNNSNIEVNLTLSDTSKLNKFFGEGTFSEKIDLNRQSLSQQMFDVSPDNFHPFPQLNATADYLQQSLLRFQTAQLEIFKDKNDLALQGAIDDKIQQYGCADRVELFQKYSDNDDVVKEMYSDYKELHLKQTLEVLALNSRYSELNTAYSEFRDHFLDEFSSCSFDDKHKLGIVEKQNELVDGINLKINKSLNESAYLVDNSGSFEFASTQFSNLNEQKNQQFIDSLSPTKEQKIAVSNDLIFR